MARPTPTPATLTPAMSTVTSMPAVPSFWAGTKGSALINAFNGGSSAKQLSSWLAKFRDLPVANRVFALAAKRKTDPAAEAVCG